MFIQQVENSEPKLAQTTRKNPLVESMNAIMFFRLVVRRATLSLVYLAENCINNALREKMGLLRLWRHFNFF
jgi:hypothetical protein